MKSLDQCVWNSPVRTNLVTNMLQDPFENLSCETQMNNIADWFLDLFQIIFPEHAAMYPSVYWTPSMCRIDVTTLFLRTETVFSIWFSGQIVATSSVRQNHVASRARYLNYMYHSNQSAQTILFWWYYKVERLISDYEPSISHSVAYITFHYAHWSSYLITWDSSSANCSYRHSRNMIGWLVYYGYVPVAVNEYTLSSF